MNILRGVRSDIHQKQERDLALRGISSMFPGDEQLHLEIMDYFEWSWQQTEARLR